MYQNHLAILQLDCRGSDTRLAQAYHTTRARFERLTAAGPLRFYRRGLLADADRAYQALRSDSNVASTRPKSLLARRVAQQGQQDAFKLPTRSPITTTSILADKAVEFKARSVAHLRQEHSQANHATASNSPCTRSEHEQALIEDQFCKEVIYRLEGEMIRYDSRRELLALADHMEIGRFRANMLLAQIVEAVRQHKLFKEPHHGRHRKSSAALERNSDHKTGYQNSNRGTRQQTQNGPQKLSAEPRSHPKTYLLPWIIATTALLAAALDLLLLRWLVG